MFSKQIHHYVYVSHIENIPLLSGHSAQCAQNGQVQSVLYHTERSCMAALGLLGSLDEKVLSQLRYIIEISHFNIIYLF